jgi:hypothetical protein
MGMRRWHWTALLTHTALTHTALTLAVLTLAGCQSAGPLVEAPRIIPAGAPYIEDSNPVYVPLGPESYGHVFETALSVLIDYGFEIRESNRWDGSIETMPRIAPGIALFLKPGSPDLYDRLLATLQTYRHRVRVNIQPADNGGFFVKVTALKELEDLPRPIRSTVGAAIFRNENDVARQFEVIDPTFFDANWIYRGQDCPLEQELIRRLKKCM